MVKEHVGGDQAVIKNIRTNAWAIIQLPKLCFNYERDYRQTKTTKIPITNKNVVARIKIGGKTWGALKTWGRFSQSVFITIASDRKAL